MHTPNLSYERWVLLKMSHNNEVPAISAVMPELPEYKVKRKSGPQLIATFSVWVATIVLTILAAVGRLNYVTSVPKHSSIFIVSDWFWFWFLLICAVMIGVSFFFTRLMSWSMSLTAASIIIWGIFNLTFSVRDTNPVSLAGPFLGICMGVGALSLAYSWNVTTTLKSMHTSRG